ncbi:CoB--CoM heterodisulfide reductase iron-sulfur subunit B family protein [Candidatus Pacearchaeota archaeon]|nr:CoB--CoM heterodisulfide reductase iron-sulfur subunit B family protein [Candidatus Pacearchaeota archaeon]
MKVPYYPGCAMKTTARNCETAGRAVARKLGIELIELPKWNCCGVFPALTSDDIMRHVAPIRNLIRVEEMNKNGTVQNEYRVITFCSMCFHTLKEANLFVKDKENLTKINTFIDREEEYKRKVRVLSFLELLNEEGVKKISAEVRSPLKNLRVAPYYGCLLLRPREISIDNPENPTILEKLLKVLGADVIENPNKGQCCGSYHTVDQKSLVAKLTYDNLLSPIRNGADIIATCCPLCAFNLDWRQKETKELHRDLKEIPIVYYTQLMAIAFGLDESFYGFDMGLHYIDPKPLLKEKNFMSA